MKSTVTRPFQLRQNQWDLDAVIGVNHVLNPTLLERVPALVLDNFQRLLAQDVYSEGDAQALYDYIWARRAQMSEAFLSMLTLWLADELKHYEALRRTYHCIAGVSYPHMNACFAARIPETTPIARVLEDEFTILVTLMFDEISSVYSYRRDLRDYYDWFDAAVQRVGQHLVQDEGMHFQNAAQVLLREHSHRLSEVEPLLHEVAGLEASLRQYYKLFLLDHAQEQFRFPRHFSSAMIQMVLAQLGLGDRPSTTALRSLWQWAPQGYDLVPVGID